MELPNFDSDEPEFFNLDEEIRKATEIVEGHKDKVVAIEVEYATKYNEVLAKIEKLRASLNEIHSKKYVELDKSKTEYDEASRRLAELRRQKEEEAKSKLLEDTVILIKEICEDFAAWHKAREYQVEDVVQIVHQYMIGSSGIMNANDMALGKTFESLVALKIIIEIHKRNHGKEPTIYWLTKKSILLTGGTVNEARRWFPELKIFSIKGGENKAQKDLIYDFAAEGGICVITNYENAKYEAAKKVTWDILIMDEVHKLKGGANSSGPTAIWEAVKELDVRFQMMLTGTPLVNRIEEIWSYLHLFDPILFPDAKKFARQFSAYRDISGKMQFSLQSERLLKDILKGRLIRRTATEVGLQLPPTISQDIILPHNLIQGDLYEKMRTDFFIWLDQQEGKALSATSILAQLTRLRQINVLPVCRFDVKDKEGNVIETVVLDERDSSKLDEAIDLIQQTNDQALVFCNFNEPLEELAMRLSVEGISSAVISSAHGKDMSKYEVGFQQKEIDCLLINSAMGEGLNLQKDIAKWPGGARAVITLDRWWNNARNDQCIKRAVRPGSNEPVMIYNLYCENSVDFFIKELCDDKDSQFKALTESNELRPSDSWKSHLQGLL